MFAFLVSGWLVLFGLLVVLVFEPSTVGLPGSVTGQQGPARALAEAMRAEENALLKYGRANIGASGVIAPSSLTMPVPFNAPSGTVAYIGVAGATRMAVVYDGAKRVLPGALVHQMVGMSDNAADAGLSSGGFVASPAGSVTALPAAIPTGVAVIADPITP